MIWGCSCSFMIIRWPISSAADPREVQVRAHPPSPPNFLHACFSGKIDQLMGWPPFGLAHSCQGNPESATGDVNLLSVT